MMWKTLIFLAVTSVVLAGKINKHHTNYEFHIQHDYDYHKHHEDVASKEENIEEKQQEEQEPEQPEEKKEEETNEEETVESEPQTEDDVSNTEAEESDQGEKKHLGYEFSYKVKDHHTHDIKGQQEKKYGEEIKGVYWLLQPDGYKRTVDYHTDKHNGFHAKVEYSKPEEHEEEEDSKPTSEYSWTLYHGHKKYIPVTEEQEEEEQDRQQESAKHIPIYVI